MKKIKIRILLLIIIGIIISVILQSCSSAPPPQVVVDPKMMDCCPGGAGLLDSNVNNRKAPTNEYASVIQFGQSEDILWFTTSREFPDKKQTSYPAELMFSKRPSSMRLQCPSFGWSPPERFKSEDSKFDSWVRGAVAFYGNKMIVVAERPLPFDEKDPSNTMGTSFNLDLWELTKTGDTYENPKPISNVNTEFWESQPTVSPDGRILCFVSNRPIPNSENKNAGDKNIWYSIRTNDTWGEPKPLPGLNTRGEEISPFWGPDYKFYYSSNWDKMNDTTSSNGFDVFVCEDYEIVDGVRLPVKPYNINDMSRRSGCGESYKCEINSAADECFPFVTPDGNGIYYTSSKPGGYGKLDLYACSMPKACIRLVMTVRKRLVEMVDGKMKIISNYETLQNYPLQLKGQSGTKPITSEVEEKLEPFKTYEVLYSPVQESCYSCDCGNKTISITTFNKDTVIRDTVYCDCVRKGKEQVTISGGVIPYFLTGYWWPLTSKNYQEFLNRKGNGSLEMKFIDPVDYNYGQVTKTIDEFFETNIYSKLSKLSGDIAQCADSTIIKVTIHGYTDKCPLVPGKYSVDDEVTVGDIIIDKGFEMWKAKAKNTSGKLIDLKEGGQNGNIILSKLRSYYTYKTIDEAMRQKSKEYAALADKGQVQFDYEGYGIFERCPHCPDVLPTAGNELDKKPSNPEPCNHPMSRRIVLYFELINQDANRHYKLDLCGKPDKNYQKWLDELAGKVKPEVAKTETDEAKPPKEDESSTGCTGPNCYVVVYGKVDTQEEFQTIKDFLSKLNIKVESDVMENGKIKIISERLTYDNAEQALKSYKSTVESFIRGLVKDIKFRAYGPEQYKDTYKEPDKKPEEQDKKPKEEPDKVPE